MGLNPTLLARIKANVATNSVQQPIPEQPKLEASSAGKAELSKSIESLQAIANSGVSQSQTVDSFKQGNSAALNAGQIRYQQVSDKIIDLESAVKSAHPQMSSLLHDIWSTLIKYPECVTLLTEDQICSVVSGLEKQVDTDLAAITIKSATKGSKKAGPVSASDLGF